MMLSSCPADRLVGLEKLSAEPILSLQVSAILLIGVAFYCCLDHMQLNYNPCFHSSDGGVIDQSGLYVTSVTNLRCSFLVVVVGGSKCEFSLDSFYIAYFRQLEESAALSAGSSIVHMAAGQLAS